MTVEKFYLDINKGIQKCDFIVDKQGEFNGASVYH